jgi:hypothetical protein
MKARGDLSPHSYCVLELEENISRINKTRNACRIFMEKLLFRLLRTPPPPKDEKLVFRRYEEKSLQECEFHLLNFRSTLTFRAGSRFLIN